MRASDVEHMGVRVAVNVGATDLEQDVDMLAIQEDKNLSSKEDESSS